MSKKAFAIVFAALIAFAAPADAGQRKAYIGICLHSTDNEIWNQMAEGGKMFAASLPPGSAEVQILTCEGVDEKQINGIKAFIASHGSDAMLFVDPSNAPNTAVIAEICEDARVYWTSGFHLAEGLNPKNFKYYVMHQSTDGVKQGYDIAVKLFNAFPTPGKGKVLALQGMLGNDAAVERYQGFLNALEEYPDVELLDMQVCNWNPQCALSTTETWLARYADVDGVWSANDLMALGAIQALKAKGLAGKVKVVGIDGISGALAAVDSGDMVCTVANNGYMQGGYGAAYAYAAWSGKIVPGELPDHMRGYYIDGFLIDKDNIEAYRDKNLRNLPEFDFADLEFPVSRTFHFAD